MTLAQDITRHFGGDWHGKYGSFPAPGHSKSDRGVTVKDTRDGDVLFNSFNGADWRDIKDECRRIGLLPDLEQRTDGDQAARETGHYEYADEAGEVLYRTVRIEQPGKRKRFLAQRPDGRGGWTGKLGEVRRVLYRLPELHKAINRATLTDTAMPRVYLVEGERKADKLASWGLLATAVAFGCKGWRREYADALSGCEVVILPDNDAEGHDFAARAAKDIEATGATAAIVDLPDLPPRGDVMDWSGTREDLEKLVAETGNKPEPTFALADLLLWSATRASPKPFIMPGFIPAGEVTLTTGKGGANKSTFGQQLATACAAGALMLGVAVKCCTTLYLSAEDDEDRLHWMQEHICTALGVAMAGLVGKLHLGSLRGRLGNELGTFDHEGRLRPSAAFKALRATIMQTKATLVVLDNASHLFAGNENDRGQVTAFVNLLYALCRELGVTIVLVAHTNKAGDSWSGSTAWLNAVRSQLVIERPEDSLDPDERVMTVGKANYARPDQQLRFRWHDFSLVRDEDLPADTRAEIAAVVAANAENDAFLRCLDIRNEQERPVSESPASRTYAPKEFAAMAEAKGLKQRQLEAAMDRLFRAGEIEVGQVCRTGRKDRFGVRRKCADPRADPAPTGCADPAPTPRSPAPAHTPYINISGAAFGAAAPPREEEGERLGAPVFPAADDDSDLDAQPYRSGGWG